MYVEQEFRSCANQKGIRRRLWLRRLIIDAKRISKIERGVISASYNDMILFSEFFGVTLDYLIIGKRQDVDVLKKRVQDAIMQLQEALM